MSYLTSIVGRAAGVEPVLQPRIAGRFESGGFEETTSEVAMGGGPPARRDAAGPAASREERGRAVRVTAGEPPALHEHTHVSNFSHITNIDATSSTNHEHHLHETTIHNTTTPASPRDPATPQPEHHHHHTTHETLHEITHETQPPLRALLQPQQVRTNTITNREHTTSTIREQRVEEAPTIHVTIGRVDVRAVSAPQQQKQHAPRPKPFTLDDYLQLRNGERR
ncbi:MAG: hypothetical protein ACLGH0_04320 [Thermoanaerobaculia bacterium]